jgi:hypothetical protein
LFTEISQNGPKGLELLFRAIVFHPSVPLLLADDDRHYQEASVGASKLLDLPREKIVGRRLDDFIIPDTRPVISERWRRFLEQGEQVGTLPLMASDGTAREVEYIGKGNVLPARNLLVLRDKTKPVQADKDSAHIPYRKLRYWCSLNQLVGLLPIMMCTTLLFLLVCSGVASATAGMPSSIRACVRVDRR